MYISIAYNTSSVAVYIMSHGYAVVYRIRCSLSLHGAKTKKCRLAQFRGGIESATLT